MNTSEQYITQRNTPTEQWEALEQPEQPEQWDALEQPEPDTWTVTDVTSV